MRRFVISLALFLVGFVVVGAVLLLRAPGDPRTSSLAAEIVPPSGYVLLDDGGAGAGPQTAGSTASLLGVGAVHGWRDALLRAWGRRPGEDARAVVVLLVAVDSAAHAEALRDGYVAAHASTAFSAPEPLRGFREGPDDAGRYQQRAVFARGNRLWVVTVVSPRQESSTTEVVHLALSQTRSNNIAAP